MRAAIIENNTISNIVEANALADVEAIFPAAEVLDAATLPDGVGIGHTRNGEDWVPSTPSASALAALAPWQFRAMLRMSGHEQAVKDFIAQLPEPQKSVAEAQLDYSLEYRRDHPLVESIRQVVDLTETELDTLWQQGLALTL